MEYLVLKSLHIASSMVLVGTGAGIAFFMLMAVVSKQPKVIYGISKIVILADWCFTAPAVVVQLLTGIWLMNILNISYVSLWFLIVISLFIFIGLCWIPVVVLQYKLSSLASVHQDQEILPDEFYHYFKLWCLLGVPAFIAILTILYFMVFKPWFY